MTIRVILVVLLSLMLLGCGYKTQAKLAPALGYKKIDQFYGTGYEERKISKNKYEVSATGHAMTTHKRLLNLATARAAHIGIENRYKYFKIVSNNSSVKCHTRYVNRNRADTLVSEKLKIIAVYSNNKKDTKYQASNVTFKEMKSRLEKEPIITERLKSHSRNITACHANQPRRL